MSWREQSTFKPSSALVDEEKEFLKLAKKVREALKLEERKSKGDALEQNQLDKIVAKDRLLNEIADLAVKLPGRTEAFDKNPDIMDLLPSDARQSIQRKRSGDQARRQQREVQEVQDRHRAEYLCRHEKPIVGVTVSSDAKFLFTCSKDKYVLCWSLSDPLLKCVCTFAGHTGAVWAVDISASFRLLSGGADSSVILWSNPTRQKQCSVVAPTSTFDHGGIVKVLRWCPFDDGEGSSESAPRFASASDKLLSNPPIIAVWRMAGTRPQQVLKLDNLPTRANDLQWARGSKTLLISAHDNGYVGIWMADQPGTLLKTLQLHKGPVTALHVACGGATLLTASHDQTAKAVNISNRETETLATYRANRPLRAVTVSADFKAGEAGSIVVAGGRAERDITTSKDLVADEFEGTVLDSESGQPLASGKGHIGPVHQLLALPSLGPNGAFATVSEDACLRIHDIQDGTLLFSDTPM